MATENPIIAALAHVYRLPWARCTATVLDRGRWALTGARCCMRRGHGAVHESYDRGGVHWTGEPSPLPDTLESWRAEWAAEHPGEPGPVREWASEDGRVWWAVGEPALVERHRHRVRAWVAIRVGRASAYLSSCGWVINHAWGLDSADVADLARMMAAVDKAGA